MAFSVSEFSSVISKRGLARDNLFEVRITPPSFLTNILEETFPSRELMFYCKSAEIPGFNTATLEYANQGYGHFEKRVTNLSFDDLNLIFLVDSDHRITQFFHIWMQAVVNYDNRDPNKYSIMGNGRGLLPFQLAYREDIESRIRVTIYGSHDDKPSYEYEFGRAYPITMGATSLSWENNEGIINLPIAFTFSEFIPPRGISSLKRPWIDRGSAQPLTPELINQSALSIPQFDDFLIDLPTL